MGRKHTFIDSQFGLPDYDADDPGEFERDLVFAIMPFEGDENDAVYAAIQDACRAFGLRPRRADEDSGSGFVVRAIVDLIERAEFIICDLTSDRPNVYYELGYAHRVGNEADDILLIARKGTVLHFDISPLRVNYYDSIDGLREMLRARLDRMMRATRR